MNPDDVFEDEIQSRCDRMPKHLTVFALGFAISVSVGAALGLLSGSGVWQGRAAR